MDVFGPQWAEHADRLERNWRRVVGPQDTVLVCGDLSWAMTLAEARPDLDFIESLPGQKYIIRGNHDYWYGSPSRVRDALGPSTHLIRFDAAVVGGVGICGVRGWPWPGQPEYDEQQDGKLWKRAIARLGLSLGALKRLDWRVAVAMFHYPPRSATQTTDLSRMVVEAGVRHCIYGHLHGLDAESAFEGEADGVLWRCVSADHVDFTPQLICEQSA